MSKPSAETKIFLEQVVKAFAKDKEMQNDLQSAFKRENPDYRDRIKREEMALAQIRETPTGEIEDNFGNPVDEEYVELIDGFVDKRMLTESPELHRNHVEYRGGVIIPDVRYHLKEVERSGRNVPRRN